MPNLRDLTLELLQNRPAKLELTQVAKEADVPYVWLCKFHQGNIADPKYLKLQKLHDYLVSKKKEQPQLL